MKVFILQVNIDSVNYNLDADVDLAQLLQRFSENLFRIITSSEALSVYGVQILNAPYKPKYIFFRSAKDIPTSDDIMFRKEEDAI